MATSYKSLVIYIIKCIAGTLSIFAINSFVHYANVGWALISVILVLSPEGHDTLSTAINRIKANAIGAGIGMLCLFATSTSNMWTISLAIALTLIASHFLNLDTSTRTALAATIIVMLHQPGTHLWDAALQRVIAVFAGAVLGLIITIIFHLFYKMPKPELVEIRPEEKASV